MSTMVSPGPSTGQLDISSTRPVPFARLVKVELRKSYDTRAGLWLLIVTAALTMLAMAIVLAVTTTQDEPITFEGFIATTAYTSAFLLPVLGIMLVTSEWGQRTAMVTFTLVPKRSLVILAKLVAGLALAGLVVLVALVAAVFANLLYAAIEGTSPAWEFGTGRFLGFIAVQAFAMLTGFALATLFLNTAAAIVVYFAYSFILPAIFAIAAGFLGWFEKLQPWIDFNLAQGPLLTGDMQGDDWGHLLVSGIIWLVLPVTVGLWRVLRAEVK